METNDEEGTFPPKLFGLGMGVTQAPIMGVVAYVLFEDVPFAAAVAVLAGVGGVMFLPYILSLGAVQEGAVSAEVLPAFGGIHVGALGAALDTAAIVAIAVRFVVDATIEPIAIAIGYATVAFVVLRFVLPGKRNLLENERETDGQWQ